MEYKIIIIYDHFYVYYVLRGALYLYSKAWISAYCIDFIECLVITQICFAMQ